MYPTSCSLKPVLKPLTALVVIASAALPPCRSWALPVTVEAESEPIAEAIEQSLPARRLSALETEQGADFWLRRLNRDGAKALEPLGYYSAELSAEWIDGEIYVSVDPGEPVRVSAINIDTGNAEFTRPKPNLRVGDALNHGDYERDKQALHRALLAAGYLSASLEQHRVEVQLAQRSANITLRWTPGPRYKLSEVVLPETPLRARFMQRYLPPQGEYITAELLSDLAQHLTAAPYFASALALPDASAAVDDRMPVKVDLSMANRSIYEVGLSIGTDSGPGTQLDVTRNWINSRGHRALAQIDIATRRQSLATRYEVPSQSDLHRNVRFDLNYVDEQTDSADRQSWRLSASQSRRWHGWRLSWGLSALSEKFVVGQQRDQSYLLMPNLSLARTEADDVINPNRGWRLRTELIGTDEAIGSDVTFVSLETQAKWVQSLGERSRVLVRGRVGAMEINKFAELPASLRFFAGGDRSVRGFDIESLGPEEAGEVIGGQYVVDGSVELDYLFKPKWRLAGFVDAGNAFTDSKLDLAYSAGIGIRWLSPVGPLRLDVAKPLSDQNESWRLHFSAGPDL